MLKTIGRRNPRKSRVGCEGLLRGRSLIVRCDSCIHEATLEDESCIKNLSRLLIEQGEMDRLILRRGIDREYHGDALEALRSLSRLASACSGLTSAAPGGKRCRGCAVNPEVVFGAIWRMMPEPDTGTARSLLAKVGHEEGRCHLCVRSSLDSLDRIDYVRESVSAELSRLAYGVLEG